MGYLDYTLAKLNAAKALEDTRYREKQIEEQNKAAFLSSLVGLVPQAVGGIKDIADKQAADEAALNKLRMQEALLTSGDNTLAGKPATPVPNVGQVQPSIEEEDYSLPGSERRDIGGSDGQEGPPPDTSPYFNPSINGLKPFTSDKEALAQYEIASLRDAADGVIRRGGPSQDVEGQMPLSANKGYSITGGIVPGSVRRLESAAAKPGINISGSTTETQPNNIQSSFDIAQALKALAAAKAPAPAVVDTKESAPVESGNDSPEAPPAGQVDGKPMLESPVLDPNRDMGKSSYDISDPLSKLGPFSQAKLASAKQAMRDADIKAAAAKDRPLALPVTSPSSLLPSTGRPGPSMPGVEGDEPFEGENFNVYVARMKKKGYDAAKIKQLDEKYYGKSGMDITEESGTGGPRGAKPFQIGGDFNAPGPVPPAGSTTTGGFGGAPAAPEKPWVKGRKTTAPTTVTEEKKATAETGKTPIERLRDEERVKAEDFNTRVRSYKRLTNADFKEPNVEKLAEKAVNEIFTKRPAGNPITEMINRISGGNGMTSENERLTRSIAKKTIMKNIVAERTAIADKDQAEFLATAKIELDAATAQGKTFGLQTSRRQIPDSARKELDSQREADAMLNDVRDKAYKIAADTGNLPFGPGRFITEARIKQAAARIGSNADSVSGGFLGLSLGQGKARSLELDQGLLSSAFQAMDFSDLPADQQELLSLTKQSIQILGKAREGGKLTDADYMKYLETLFNSSNPAGFVRSLEETIDRNANRYNSNLEYFNTNYADNLSMYQPGGLREQDVDIDWNQVKETPLGAAAAGMSPGNQGGAKKTSGAPKKKKPVADD